MPHGRGKKYREVVLRRHGRRPQPAAQQFYNHMGNRAVEVRFACEHRCLFCIGVVPQQSSQVNRNGDADLDDTGIRRTEYFGEIRERGVVPEVRLIVRVCVL